MYSDDVLVSVCELKPSCGSRSLQVAYDTGDYYHAIPWLEEAVSLFRRAHGEWKTEDEASLEDALDYLAFACFQVGEQ